MKSLSTTCARQRAVLEAEWIALATAFGSNRSVDALSEILRVVQLNGAIFFNARFTAPWCVASPAETSLAKLLGVGAERVLLYHYMLEGSCLITLEGMAPLRLGAGDIVVFPHGDAHTMASSAGGQPQAMDAQAILRERPRLLHFGGGGDTTRLRSAATWCTTRTSSGRSWRRCRAW